VEGEGEEQKQVEEQEEPWRGQAIAFQHHVQSWTMLEERQRNLVFEVLAGPVARMDSGWQEMLNSAPQPQLLTLHDEMMEIGLGRPCRRQDDFEPLLECVRDDKN